MADLPSRADYFQIGADEVLIRSVSRLQGQRISADEIYTDGSDINVVIAGSSAMADETTRQLALAMASLFLDSAEGSDLDRLVADRFSGAIVRKAATPAVGTVQFSRSSGSYPATTVPAGTKVRTASGLEFATRFAASFSSMQTGPVSAPVQAIDAGSPGNVGIATITQFAQAPDDTAIVVTNAEVLAGGDDAETDSSLRARAKSFFATVSKATKAAIEFGALTVTGVRQASAIEAVDGDGKPTGDVSLYIADALGQANSALAAAVESALLEYRALGVPVDVFSATPVYVPITYHLSFDTTVDSTEAFASVQRATLAAVNRLEPNETLQVSLLFAQARSVEGVIVNSDAVVSPVGDLVPSLGQVIRTRLDLITNT